MPHLFPILLYFSLFLRVTSDISAEQKDALLKFASKITHDSGNGYSWDGSKGVCNTESPEDDNWKGVECDDGDNFVIHLTIPGAIGGEIQPGTIGKLVNLQVLKLRDNQLKGPLPDDFSNLRELTHLLLQNNKLSGTIPDHFSNLVQLTHLNLSNNEFSGTLPDHFSNLVKLTHLNLSNNYFSGKLPNIKLEEFDVSNNNFDGEIPELLSKDFPASAFAGNKNLCGHPLPACKKSNNRTVPSPAESQAVKTPHNKKPKEKDLIVGVSVGSGLLLLILLCCLGKRRINKQPQPPPEVVLPLQMPASSASGTSLMEGGDERKKLVFLDNVAGEIFNFDLEDLYRASQVVLGKGSTVGTSLKMMLKDGGETTVVVKRLKDMVVTKDEFESTMEVLGKMKSKHVVSLIAYYYSEDKKLLVYEYMPAGSLAALLHGRQDFGQTRLNWDHRMRIALSAAKGVEYLHEAKIVHGNIKSSNILLRQETNKYVASVSDYGLGTLFGMLTSKNHYQAPEIIKTQKVTFESDVYSFGVFLLELLTGKDPNQASSGNERIEFSKWVQSIIHGKLNAEVFDVELRSHQNIEEKLVQLLQIAKDCVLFEPDQRPIMQKVVSMMDDMNKDKMDDSLRQSSDDHSRAFDDTPSTETRDTPSTITP